MNVDYLIIGQGLCGTFLSWNLLKAGRSVIVVDENRPRTATKVASGVINPVTGRRVVRTWRIEEFLPFAREAYQRLGEELNAELIQPIEILDFHSTPQMKEAFEKRLQEGEEYLSINADNTEWSRYFQYHFGVSSIKSCLLIDLNTLLQKWRDKLNEANLLHEEQFKWDECFFAGDYLTYKDITAKKMVCCDGVDGFDNPYFCNLPWAKIKGEAVIATIPGLPSNYIYKQGISIVPLKDQLFWIGSSYEWSYDDTAPTELFRKKVEHQLKYWLKLPFTIVDHIASERPATIERRPFLGLHPQKNVMGIFNGMGTKGCSLAPFFASQLTEHLCHQKALDPEVDIRRFTKILSSSTS